ncbi:hypothetical protein ACOMHN_044866 [Nucella lapillus]
MMSAVQAIEDANKEIHHGELADVLPVGPMGGSDPSPHALQSSATLQIPHPLHHQQQQQQQQQQQHQQQHHHHPAISPHLHHQHPTTQQLQQQALQTLAAAHGLPPPPPCSSTSSSASLPLHSQGVNTSDINLDIASSSQRSHLCPTCLKGFRTKGQLTQHLLVHTNVRRHVCIYCDRAFKQLSHLQQHTRIHTGAERSHVCETCLKGFFTKQQLAQHTVVHTNIRKYLCLYCDRAFKQLSHLQQHIRIHTEKGETDKVEDRRYLCQFCDRAFKQLTHLQQHTRLHTGEKPYMCTFEGCDRAFVQMSNLQHHIRNHEEQVKKEASRVHKCLVCHRSYTNESSLRAHTLKMHIHIKQVPDGLNFDQLKKHRKKKHKLYNAPTMVPVPCHGQSIGKKIMSDSSSDDDLIIIGERKQQDFPSGLSGIPRSLVETLNHYERTLSVGMGGRKLQDGNISSSNQLGSQQNAVNSRGMDTSRGSTANLGCLMGLPGIDPVLMSAQPPEVIERAAAAAAAAVSSQLLQCGVTLSSGAGSQTTQSHPLPAHSQIGTKTNNGGGGTAGGENASSNNRSSTVTSSPGPQLQPLTPLDMMGISGAGYAPHKPYSQIMDAHLRSQMTPLTLPPVPDQYFAAHAGPPLGMLSHHARFLAPSRSMADLPMSYGSQISSAPSTATSAHATLSSAPHANS